MTDIQVSNYSLTVSGASFQLTVLFTLPRLVEECDHSFCHSMSRILYSRMH